MAEEKTFTSGFEQNFNGQNIFQGEAWENTWDTAKKDAKNYYNNLTSGVGKAYVDATSAFKDAFNADYSKADIEVDNLVNNVGRAARVFLDNKLNAIKEAWLKPQTVTVKALMGEIAPYAIDFKTASSTIVTRAKKLTAYLLGSDSSDSWMSILNDLGGQMGDFITGDPGVKNAIGSLTIVTQAADIMEGMSSTIDLIKQVTKVIETIMPIAEITVDLALVFYSGGLSATKATEELKKQSEDLIMRATAVASGIIRKYVYNMQLQVPALLVGAVKATSVRDTVKSFKDETTYDRVMRSILDDDFYNETIASDTWIESYRQTRRKYGIGSNFDKIGNAWLENAVAWSKGKADDVEDALNKIRSNSVYQYTESARRLAEANSKMLKDMFISEFTQNYLKNLKDAARENVAIPREIKESSWVKYDNNGSTGQKHTYSSLNNVLLTTLVKESNPFACDERTIRLNSKDIYDSF